MLSLCKDTDDCEIKKHMAYHASYENVCSI